MQRQFLKIILRCAFAIAAVTHLSAQTAEQKDLFSEALSTAWKNNSDEQFCRLYSTEGADQFQIDLMVSQWTAQRAYTPDATLTLKAIHSKAAIEAKASKEDDQRTGTFSGLLQLWKEPKIMNAHTYVQT